MIEIAPVETLLTPVELHDIPDPIEPSEEFESAKIRAERTRDLSTMTWLPQMPDAWAQDLYDQIAEREQRYAAPTLDNEEYTSGTATQDDEIAIITSNSAQPYLFTAEHATRTIRAVTGVLGFADNGTGGLAALLAENHGQGLIMRGRQTGNAAVDPDHPMKPLIRDQLAVVDGFVSVHGKASNMFVRTTDRTEVHAILGLGAEPDERLHEFARSVVVTARNELGLYVTIGNDQYYYVQKPKSTELKRNDDGTAKTNTLAALKPNSTTNLARSTLASMGKAAPALQIELTNILRLAQPSSTEKHPQSRVMGVALGYLLVEKIVQLGRDEYSSSNIIVA
jgi:hypothetical protein